MVEGIEMYVLGVYDVNVKRVAKVKKIFSQYMFWVQNSTFEGQLTKAQLRNLTNQLETIINPDEDQVIFYTIRNKEVFDKTIMGHRENEPSNIL